MATIKCVESGAKRPEPIDFVKHAAEGCWYRCVQSCNNNLCEGDYVLAGIYSSDRAVRAAFLPMSGGRSSVCSLGLTYRVVPVELDEEQSQLVFRESR